jgi:hypothetical protein
MAVVRVASIAILLATWTYPIEARQLVRHGDLRPGKCVSLEEARLCLSDSYWATLKVAGREVDFTAGGKVAEGIPGQAVPFEMALDGDRYRVKVEDWSTATVEFARYTEIRFRKRGSRFELTGYTAKDIDTECENGVPNSAEADFVTGRLIAKVDGKTLFVAPRMPMRLRTPDLFRFKEDQLYRPYKLYDAMAAATGKYCK